MTYDGPSPIKRRIGYISAAALERVLRLTGDYNYRFLVQQLHHAMWREGFRVGMVQYFPDACSVGLTPQGELTADSAVDMIRKRKLSDLHVLDLCCGTGIVGLTMLSRLRESKEISRMWLADINIFNVNSVRRTVEQNDATVFGNVPIEVFLSDGLASVPSKQELDVIVSNPPHFDADPFTKTQLDPVALGNADPAWKFHRDFYNVVHEYLKPGGEVWFFENGDACSDDILLPFIEANTELDYVETVIDPRDSKFFWIIARRKA